MDDPIDTLEDCGYNRCGGLGDFLDIRVDAEGRTWFALAHNIGGDSGADVGIFATFHEGPAARARTSPCWRRCPPVAHKPSEPGKDKAGGPTPVMSRTPFDGSPPPEEEQMSLAERTLFLGFMAVVGLLLLSFAYGLVLPLLIGARTASNGWRVHEVDLTHGLDHVTVLPPIHRDKASVKLPC